MNNRNYDCIIIISVISGLFITTCDYLVQMKTVETDYFVSRLLSLEETILNLSSFGCIFTFPFWILGTYFIYTTMCKVNKKLALINTFCISYSLLMLGFYHYSYAIIYNNRRESSKTTYHSKCIFIIRWNCRIRNIEHYFPSLFGD